MSCCGANCGCGTGCKCSNGCGGCSMYPDLTYSESAGAGDETVAGEVATINLEGSEVVMGGAPEHEPRGRVCECWPRCNCWPECSC